MTIEVKVPVLPESVSEATIAAWYKKVDEPVKRDEKLVDLETDKVVLEVPSPVDGVLRKIHQTEGATVSSQEVIALLEEDAYTKAPADSKDKVAKEAVKAATRMTCDTAPIPPASVNLATPDMDSLSPAARRLATEENIDLSNVQGTGRDHRITKEDLINNPVTASAPVTPPKPGLRPEERVPMTRIRARIAERLMQSKNAIAMLTSFNEVNLTEVIRIRQSLGEDFHREHGIKLGFMSFFVKAATQALRHYPMMNASVEDNDIIYHGYQDISIAIATERGLVTPVLRDVQDMSFADIEKGIVNYAIKARTGKLSLNELQGGTFTITNGGTFGSLLSTPIVNPPQSAILGMHTIKERAIVENGQLVAASMMYLAISYDHRIIDGKDAVLFLVDIKNQLENPQRMLLGL